MMFSFKWTQHNEARVQPDSGIWGAGKDSERKIVFDLSKRKPEACNSGEESNTAPIYLQPFTGMRDSQGTAT